MSVSHADVIISDTLTYYSCWMDFLLDENTSLSLDNLREEKKNQNNKHCHQFDMSFFGFYVATQTGMRRGAGWFTLSH